MIGSLTARASRAAVMFLAPLVILALTLLAMSSPASAARTEAAAEAGHSRSVEMTVDPEAVQAAAAAPAGTKAGSGCYSWGRCWVNLTKAETLALSKAKLNIKVPGPYAIPFTAFIKIHQWIAGQYYKMTPSRCLSFVFSPLPWEGRGMDSYVCTS